MVLVELVVMVVLVVLVLLVAMVVLVVPRLVPVAQLCGVATSATAEVNVCASPARHLVEEARVTTSCTAAMQQPVSWDSDFAILARLASSASLASRESPARLRLSAAATVRLSPSPAGSRPAFTTPSPEARTAPSPAPPSLSLLLLSLPLSRLGGTAGRLLAAREPREERWEEMEGGGREERWEEWEATLLVSSSSPSMSDMREESGPVEARTPRLPAPTCRTGGRVRVRVKARVMVMVGGEGKG